MVGMLKERSPPLESRRRRWSLRMMAVREARRFSFPGEAYEDRTEVGLIGACDGAEAADRLEGVDPSVF
jgi:hypothetical protein